MSQSINWNSVHKIKLSPNDEVHRVSESPSGKPGFCIDEICTCGKHSCPVFSNCQKSSRPTSTYQSVYKPITPPGSNFNNQPDNSYFNPSGPSGVDQAMLGVTGPTPALQFTGASSLKANYPGHRPQPSDFNYYTGAFDSNITGSPHLPFNEQSTLHSSFPGIKPPPQSNMFMPDCSYDKDGINPSFTGSSTMKSAFVGFKPQPCSYPVMHGNDGVQGFSENTTPKFESTMHSSYLSHRPQITNSSEQANNNFPHPETREDGRTSTNQTVYQPLSPQTCPVTKLPNPPAPAEGCNHVFYDSVTKRFY